MQSTREKETLADVRTHDMIFVSNLDPKRDRKVNMKLRRTAFQ